MYGPWGVREAGKRRVFFGFYMWEGRQLENYENRAVFRRFGVAIMRTIPLLGKKGKVRNRKS